ncbi:MAG TPA: hypothetical protein VES20_02855 [Bryobacteraceae bacterium]|nr:hypothetical protein [Bryobacteraceae bacterium]
MKHFSDEAWVDFVRQLLPPDENDRMRAHINDGCEKCAELHRLWTKVTELAKEEPKYAADEATVMSAKAMFAGRSWGKPPEAASGFMNLVFDSLWDLGAAAGVRSISATARHLLYQSNQLAVDVRIDALSERRVAIAGQILATGEDSSSGCHWQVTLLQSTVPADRAFTNDFGEFYFECDNLPDLRLRIEAEEQQPFTLVLPE